MTFKASLDKVAKIVTAVISIIFASIICLQASLLFSRVGKVSPILITLLFLSIYIISYLFSASKYSVAQKSVIIHRHIKNIVIPFDDIKKVYLVDKHRLRWSTRLWAIGGLFGYSGKFANGHLGQMTWYATNLNNAVLIEKRNGKKIVITPDNPDAFLKQITLIH